MEQGGDSYQLGDQYKIFLPFQPEQNGFDNNTLLNYVWNMSKQKCN